MKRFVRIIVLGICIGLVMVVIKESLKIGTGDFMRIYWLAAIGIIFGAVLINILYNLHYQQKVQEAIKLLEDGETHEYISALQKMLKTAKGQNLRNVLSLDLAAGYVEAKEFDMAIPMLEELLSKRLVGSGVKAVHRINLCMSYFDTEQYDKAVALYDESQKIFEQYRNDKLFGANIAILDIFIAMQSKQYERAKTILHMAEKTYDAPRYKKAFCEVAEILAKADEQL